MEVLKIKVFSNELRLFPLERNKDYCEPGRNNPYCAPEVKCYQPARWCQPLAFDKPLIFNTSIDL
jgi:hypothetical protein